jgi:inner membrane protein YidH
VEGKIPESETLSREHLANERTLLSWMRTGINAISVGILLGFAARLFSEGATSSNLLVLGSRKEELSLLGIGMIVFGAFLELVAVARFVHYKHSIEQGTFTSSALVYLFIVFSLILLGVAYIIYDVVA